MQFKSLGLALICAVALVLPVWAHHSHNNYAISDFTLLEGTVKQVHLVVPHSWVYVEIKDEKGEPHMWALEATGPNGLLNNGIKREDVKVGDLDQDPLPQAAGWFERLPARLHHAHARRHGARPRRRERMGLRLTRVVHASGFSLLGSCSGSSVQCRGSCCFCGSRFQGCCAKQESRFRTKNFEPRTPPARDPEPRDPEPEPRSHLNLNTNRAPRTERVVNDGYNMSGARRPARVHQAPPAEARMAEGPRPRIGELSPAQGDDEGPEAEHGVRGCSLSQHWRMLASRHRHVHDPRRRVHACVRVLRRDARAAE